MLSADFTAIKGFPLKGLSPGGRIGAAIGPSGCCVNAWLYTPRRWLFWFGFFLTNSQDPGAEKALLCTGGGEALPCCPELRVPRATGGP